MRYEKDGLSGIGDEYGNGNNGICGGAKSVRNGQVICQSGFHGSSMD